MIKTIRCEVAKSANKEDEMEKLDEKINNFLSKTGLESRWKDYVVDRSLVTVNKNGGSYTEHCVTIDYQKQEQKINEK
jgi:hypothetical protein